ncbi:hypothetical protein [Streptomyces sp. A012304]|uniref:hypothetical protein n=1 Tax=Streptomyces sp. A012304 TaxID=375446 RepID=UPI0022319595|nr:hypothetical protein [Streptomyces sp. A012304]GKQ40975.1 hypothetical protein ALMP_74940 [Streptomyces sp. A012304]
MAGFVGGVLPVVLLSFALTAVGFGAAGLVILRHGTGLTTATGRERGARRIASNDPPGASAARVGVSP